MALSFPLTTAQFINLVLLPITQTWTLGEASEYNETAGGEVIPASYGPRLWQGTVQVATQSPGDHENAVARLELLNQAGASFMMSPLWRDGPQSDPDGSILGASTPQITNVNANMRDITISGLPVGYLLTRGDYLGFGYGSPTRFAFHRIVTGGTANGSGVAGSIEVSPPIRPGYSVPFDVDLVRPRLKAVVVPGSFRPGTYSRYNVEGFSFSWRQTLR